MTVKELLKKQDNNIEIKIFQKPIKSIDSNNSLVKRYQGEKNIALNSNQNYLDFEVISYYKEKGCLKVVCLANREQELKTINAFKSVF